jgi:murein L,D-transpeptidase YcbB/YkuD
MPMPRVFARLVVVGAWLIQVVGCSSQPVQSASASTVQASPEQIAARIRAEVVNSPLAELRALYEAGGYAPLWIDADGSVNGDAREALVALERAADEGLEPADYVQPELNREPAAAFDVALSSGMLRFLHDVGAGRVDPRTVGAKLSVAPDRQDLALLLRSAVANHRIPDTIADARPPFAQYSALRAMLARYRLLAAAAGETGDVWQGSDAVVRPGDRAEALDVLYRLLVGFGDLPERAPAPGAIYDGVLVAGVKHFQRRHGLETDGVLGARTQTALRVPLAWRARQIELALERLRWLPRLGDRRLVVLNIPMFRIWAWDATPPSGEPLLGMNAIVGRALKTETPVFMEEMREVIFRPYWNVPRSILRKETLPLIARDPGYLSRENMEIVRGQGDDARPVEATPENLALLRQGALRVRQRPGPSNALGLIKFVFPNEENVYMHGTPAKTLFARSRRDFSHGCVRVEDPVALAEWALKDRPEWNRERILAAMEGPRSLHVSLTRPIQVILFYTTAAVMPEDGTIRFVEDIYGHDQRLDRALSSLPNAR